MHRQWQVFGIGTRPEPVPTWLQPASGYIHYSMLSEQPALSIWLSLC